MMVDVARNAKEAAHEPLIAPEGGPVFGRLTSHPDGMGSMLLLTQGSSLRGTIFNLLNTMIGGGVLGLPFAARQCGIVLGAALLLGTALMTDLTAWMLLVSVDFVRSSSYAMVGEALYGRWLGLLIDLVVLCNTFGVLVSYVVVLGDLVPPFLVLMGVPPLLHDRTVVLWASAGCVLLPLSLLRSMGALRHVSLVCMVMIAMFMCLMVAMGSGIIQVPKPAEEAPALLMADSFAAVAGQLPVVMFAYNCLMNVPFLYAELRQQRHQDVGSKFATKRAKMMVATHVSIGVGMVIYVLVSVFGYLAFGDSTHPDILTNLNYTIFAPSPYVKVCYSLVIFCSFPVMCFSCVASLHRLAMHCLAALRPSTEYDYRPLQAWSPLSSPRTGVWPIFSPQSTVAEDAVASPRSPLVAPQLTEAPVAECGALSEPPSDGTRRFEALVVVLASTAAGVQVPNLSIVFSVTGGLCGGALTFVFPGLFFARVQSRSRDPPGAVWKWWLGQTVFWFGVVVSLGTTGFTVWQL